MRIAPPLPRMAHMTTHAPIDAMNHQQLRGLHARLERELAGAFQVQPLPAARIERLVQAIAATERAIDTFQPLAA